QSQWERLSQAVLSGELPLLNFPPHPQRDHVSRITHHGAEDLFVAVEYELDEFGNFKRIVNIYRESEVRHKVGHTADGAATQMLLLHKPFEGPPREAWGYRRLAAGGSLVPALNPIAGQDDVELR